jgi:hypothetical protein
VEVEAVGAVVDLGHPQAQELGELAVDAQVGLVAEGVGAVTGELRQVLVGRGVGPAVRDGHIGDVGSDGHGFSLVMRDARCCSRTIRSSAGRRPAS